MWLRSEGRLFGIVFVLFNVLLGVFNVLNYRVASRATVPCVVIVAPTPPAPVAAPQTTSVPEQQVDTSAPPQASAAWTDIASSYGKTFTFLVNFHNFFFKFLEFFFRINNKNTNNCFYPQDLLFK